ncbi:MAG: hypothetical protein JWP64_4647 [Pseudonocardia sp.]|jgi:hypothetical protein|uniref:baeRF2 domain-containing protein n=1 Tax=Pseudonocardia sp. TaxID=60912 RepID=UPI00260B0F2B|nr:Vms1/Ankzf1 family peptidyl-tRNA hydrolase [Pseudonocardia sp.]MCU1629698.1 hypothetical protein [Pseudonocardia sp.]
MRLDWLRTVAEQSGPCGTVLLDATHETHDAEHIDRVQWRGMRETLTGQGADDATVAALDRAVTESDPPSEPSGRVLVAAGGGVVLDTSTPRRPDPQEAVWGPIADLIRIVANVPEPVTTVVVRIDETGGEILAPDTDGVEAVEGRDRPVHKVRGGGWSHMNMQERVEESWRRNTAQVAERVDEHVHRTGARLLVIAGETRSRSRLVDALSERSAGIAVEVEHSAGSSVDELHDVVDRAVEDLRHRDRQAALERYRELEAKPDGLAAAGLRTAAAAFREQACDTVVVDPEVLRGARLWAAGPTEVAITRDELTGLGLEPVEVDAGSALVRAAACSGAELVVLDEALRGENPPVGDGVGVVLRHAL